MSTKTGFGAWASGGGGWGFGGGAQTAGRSRGYTRPQAAPPPGKPKSDLTGNPTTPLAPPQRVLKPESIRQECDASLQRLGVERIDLYQFHWPDETGTPVEDSWREMVRLIEEGKVRLAGVSNFNVSLLERCEAIRHVDSLQPPFSLIRRQAAPREIPLCA